MSDKPNIVFLMSDQQRWDALGVNSAWIQTPHLDALAKEGINFQQAVCNNPMCVPSRYSMMLGLYSQQIGVRHNGQFCPNDDVLPAKTVAQHFKEHGYQTAGFGKTHWYINYESEKVKTTTRGFDIRVDSLPFDCPDNLQETGAIGLEQHAAELYEKNKLERTRCGPGGESREGYIGFESSLDPGEHREGWLTQQVLAFLEQRDAAAAPLFLYVSFLMPHALHNPPAVFSQLYDDVELPDDLCAQVIDPNLPSHGSGKFHDLSTDELQIARKRYAACCTYIDSLYGQIIEKMKSMNAYENSLFVFTSDHGDMLGERARYSKYCLYEGSVRVPLLMSGFGIDEVSKDTVSDVPAELVDLLPTLLSVANLTVPPELPGQNLIKPNKKTGSFAEYYGRGDEASQMAPTYMWRTKEWKLILSMGAALSDLSGDVEHINGELYHLQHDVQEMQNLYDNAEYLPIREQLTRQLLMHLAVVHSKSPFQLSTVPL